MKKITKIKPNLRIFILLIYVYSALNTYSLAQTTLQKIQIKRKVNSEVLNKMAVNFKNKAIQEKQEAFIWANSLGYPIRGMLANGSQFELMRLDENGMPGYYVTCNLNASKTISTNKIQIGGSSGLNLMGTGITIGLWDNGLVDSAHSEFGGRATQGVELGGGFENSMIFWHSTHVAGTLIAQGLDINARGMATGAKIIFFL